MNLNPYPRDLVGYGRTPPQARWPGEANVAVQFVINYEEGGENSNPAWRPGVGSLPIRNRRRRTLAGTAAHEYGIDL